MVVSAWLAVEWEKVALLGGDRTFVILHYSVISVCNLFDVTQWRSLATKFPYIDCLAVGVSNLGSLSGM